MKNYSLLLALAAPIAVMASCTALESSPNGVPGPDAGGAGGGHGDAAADAAKEADAADAADAGHEPDAADAGHEPDAADAGHEPDAADAPDSSDASADALGSSDASADALGSSDASADAPDSSDAAASSDAADAADAVDSTPNDGGSCAPAVVEQHAWEGALHVDVCSLLTFVSNPPSSGNHYPIWAAFHSFTEPVPRGFYVHDLEHGAVTILYNCPGGCAAQVAAAQAWIDSLPADPLCGDGGPPHNRIVLTPDPLLDTEWAASAWLWTLKAHCFDAAAFGQFVTDHYGLAPEDECEDGIDPIGVCP